MRRRFNTALRSRRALIALGAMALTVPAGCNDDEFLTEVPYDFVGPTNFYKTAGDALAALNGAYASLQHVTVGGADNYYGRNFVMLVEYSAEAVTTRLSATNERTLTDVYTYTTGHAYIYTTWQGAWGAINRTNAVIDRVPGIDMDAGLKARIVAEAKFLRALNYFNLVRLFGGVPIFTTETTSLSDIQGERATAAAVYDLVIKDLQDAIGVLPSSKLYAASDFGRASRGAAKTLLAKAYLQRGATGVGQPSDYQLALDMARQVVADGDYSLVANPGTLYDLSTGLLNERNTEVIFDIQNIRQTGSGGRLGAHFNPTNAAWGVSQNASFEAEQPFFDSFSDADKRKAVTFAISYPHRNGTTVTWTPTTTASQPYGGDTPFFRKFVDPTQVTQGQEEPNYIILRYADLLLMVAEAANEVGGPTGEAYGAINQIRARAGLPNLTAGLSKQLFKDSVFVERRKELVMEGPNAFFDSQRYWDWAKARVEANMALGRANSFRNSKYPKAQTAIVDKFKLMPIPQRAIDLNPKLTQNPGW
jgi:starch-binding outer membrane protein, SusD/RagB family